MWLEESWDHKFLAWANDPLLTELANTTNEARKYNNEPWKMLAESIVWVPFNPTAENMAEFLLDEIGPAQLKETGCILTSVTIEETRKCSVSCHLET